MAAIGDEGFVPAGAKRQFAFQLEPFGRAEQVVLPGGPRDEEAVHARVDELRHHAPGGAGAAGGAGADGRRCHGADRGILVQTDTELQPLAVAKLIKAVLDVEQASIVILGKQAIDDDCNQTGQMLAALAGLPQATFASKVSLSDGGLQVTREVDGGLEVLQLTLPAVLTTDLRLNEPRYVTLPNIMKAKKKTIEVRTPAELGVDVTPRLKTLKVVEPTARKSGVKVADVATLVDKLRNEDKVI